MSLLAALAVVALVFAILAAVATLFAIAFLLFLGHAITEGAKEMPPRELD